MEAEPIAMDLGLKDKVALITGAGKGIGLRTARRLAAEGCHLGLCARSAGDLAAAAGELRATGVRVATVPADVTVPAQAAQFVERSVAELGGIDILINNVGGSSGGNLMEATDDDWRQTFELNVFQIVRMIRLAVPHLRSRGGGSIVNIASIAGLLASVPIPAYGAAKAGVISLSKSLALELAPHNIRVNAICPGFLWTRAWEMLAMLMKMGMPQYADKEPHDIFLDQVKRGVPLGREQTPEDIGKLAVFLSSTDGQNITGQAISVDGGITLRVGPA
jgi:NAD(P)-dependent dehydrogenase (short-subunit alcohol dehydrogenase family)